MIRVGNVARKFVSFCVCVCVYYSMCVKSFLTVVHGSQCKMYFFLWPIVKKFLKHGSKQYITNFVLF